MPKLVLDSNEFIFAFREKKELHIHLLDVVEDLDVLIPSTILEEVFERLKFLEGRDFASRVRNTIANSSIMILESSLIPADPIKKYISKGLKESDASIAAFTEWVQAGYLISENRHFLKLKTNKFKVVDAKRFLKSYEQIEK